MRLTSLAIVASISWTLVPDVRAQARAAPLARAPGGSPTRPHDAKKPAIAVGLSILGTAAGWALLFKASQSERDSDPDGLDASATYALVATPLIILAPSIGQIHADRFLTPAMWARLAGAGAIIAAAAMASGCEHGECNDGATVALVVGGAATIVAGSVWDIASAPRAIDDWNRRHVTITPVALPGTRHPTLGLGLVATW